MTGFTRVLSRFGGKIEMRKNLDKSISRQHPNVKLISEYRAKENTDFLLRHFRKPFMDFLLTYIRNVNNFLDWWMDKGWKRKRLII